MTPCVLAIGNFDGVHEGHRHLIDHALAIAEEENLPVHVLTFWPHPRTVVRPQTPHQQLMNSEEREKALLSLGVQKVHTYPFDVHLAMLSPQEFMQQILEKNLGAQHVVVGQNFRFGHKASGDIATLQSNGHFITHAVGLIGDEKGIYSSTRLRQS